MPEFWPDFRCGGMAEWSMAVVLKTKPADLRKSRLSQQSQHVTGDAAF
jgi:hypothetical protein